MLRAGQLIPSNVFTRAPQALSSYNPISEAVSLTQRNINDQSGHNRSMQPSFERSASSQPKQTKRFASYTRTQLGERLVEMYGKDKFDGTDLVNCCVESDLVKHAGGGTYLTLHTIPEICKELENRYKPLADVRAEVTEGLKQIAKTQEQMRKITEQAYQEKKSARYAAGLSTDELRSVPSYAFCLHPDLKLALSSLDAEITNAESKGVVTNEFSSYWKTRLKNVSSTRECNQVLAIVRSYLKR